MTQAFTTESLAEGFGPRERPAPASRAFTAAQDLRAKTLRAKRMRSLVIWGLIIGATLAFTAWGAFVMRPRYAAETRFSVRGAISFPQATSTSTPVTSLISNGQQPLTSSIGFVDGFAANDFLKSRDCMEQLAKRVNLAGMLHVDPSRGDQALYRAYMQAVASRFDMIEQINVVQVSAFSPSDSRAIADALLAVTEDFVEKEDDAGAKNTLNVSSKELERARNVAKQAEKAVAEWRVANHDLDPEAEATMVMTLIGQIEQQLATAEVNYQKILAFGNPNHPMLHPAKMQVEELQRQITQARARLTGVNGSQADRLKTYTILKADEAFEEANVSAEQAFYLQALHDVNIMRRFVSVVARPIAQNTRSSPVLWMLALEGLFAGCVMAILASIGFRFLKPDHEKQRGHRKAEKVTVASPRS